MPDEVVSGLPAPVPEPLGPGIIDGLFPDGGAAEIVGALADISTGFGEAGATFIRQIGMAPAVVADLAQQVSAGTLAPGEALRRLVVAPLSALTGDADLTGNPEIDALFTNGILRPIIDALRNNVPGPIGQEDGLIDTIDDGVTEVATGIQNTVDPSAQQSSTPTPLLVTIDDEGDGSSGGDSSAGGSGGTGSGGDSSAGGTGGTGSGGDSSAGGTGGTGGAAGSGGSLTSPGTAGGGGQRRCRRLRRQPAAAATLARAARPEHLAVTPTARAAAPAAPAAPAGRRNR